MQLGDGAEPARAVGGARDWRTPVLEVAITPNRGDCLSILGIAREMAALTGARLRVPKPRLAEKAPPPPMLSGWRSAMPLCATVTWRASCVK